MSIVNKVQLKIYILILSHVLFLRKMSLKSVSFDFSKIFSSIAYQFDTDVIVCVRSARRCKIKNYFKKMT